MVTKIIKWGNSLGLRISKSIAEELNLFDGSEVEIERKDNKIVIQPIIQQDLSLEELLEGMDADRINSQP